jgi:hypothetical protein
MNRELDVLPLLNEDGIGNAISCFFCVNGHAGNFPLTDQAMAAGGHVRNVPILKDFGVSA